MRHRKGKREAIQICKVQNSNLLEFDLLSSINWSVSHESPVGFVIGGILLSRAEGLNYFFRTKVGAVFVSTS